MLKRKTKTDLAELASTDLSGRAANDDANTDLVWAAEDQMRFGLMLIEKGHASAEQVQAALWQSSVSDDSLGNTLVLQGVIRQEKLLALMEEFDSAQISTSLQYNVPIDDVEFLHREKVALFGMSSKRIFLACLGNERVVRRFFEEQFPDRELKFLAVRPQMVDAFLLKTDRLPRKTEQRVGEGRLEIVRYVPKATNDSDVLDLLVNFCGIRGGSDIHIEPKSKSYSVLIRFNQVRRIVHEGPLSQYQALRAQIKDRARMDQMEFRRPQDGAYSQEIMGRMFDLRVATFPTNAGFEKIVMRLLDPDKASKPLTALGISHVKQWSSACEYPHGLVIVSGKTNSGKSTTLISTLREQDRIGKAIYTIEDPIEHRVDFLTQMAVNKAESVQLTFQSATRAMMRGDPQIILVGEIRDRETAEAACQVAESGHLVFSTLHAGTIRESVSRLRSFGIEDNVLRPMLRGVLAQRLMRTLCPYCRKKGCPMCMQSGYAGMTVISEMGFFPSERHFNKMMKGERFWDPMVMDALKKLEANITDEHEVYRVFRSEIDHLDPEAIEEFEGIQELAERVRAVVANKAESQVSTEPTKEIGAEELEQLEIADLYEKSLGKLSRAPERFSSDNPYGDD